MKRLKSTLILLELLFAISFGNFGVALVISNLNFHSGIIENLLFGSLIVYTFTLLGILLPRILIQKKASEKKQFKSIQFASLGIIVGLIFTIIFEINNAEAITNSFSDNFYYKIMSSDPVYAPMILGVIFYNLSLYSKKNNPK